MAEFLRVLSGILLTGTGDCFDRYRPLWKRLGRDRILRKGDRKPGFLQYLA
ncbi:MAG: hypothetical protein ACRC62_24895 [Microcoleus sp.]